MTSFYCRCQIVVVELSLLYRLPCIVFALSSSSYYHPCIVLVVCTFLSSFLYGPSSIHSVRFILSDSQSYFLLPLCLSYCSRPYFLLNVSFVLFSLPLLPFFSISPPSSPAPLHPPPNLESSSVFCLISHAFLISFQLSLLFISLIFLLIYSISLFISLISLFISLISLFITRLPKSPSSVTLCHSSSRLSHPYKSCLPPTLMPTLPLTQAFRKVPCPSSHHPAVAPCPSRLAHAPSTVSLPDPSSKVTNVP